MKLLIYKVSGVAIILFVIYLCISVYVANRITSGYPHPITTSPTTVAPTYESVSFPANDSAVLKGWFFKNTSDKAVIFVHGITQDRVNKDYDTTDIAKELYAQGYSILMYDSRGHGESPEKRAGFGITGGQDILGAVKFVESKGFKSHHIGIIADSNGAISLLMVSDKLKDIGALISDSAAATYQPVMTHVLRDQNGIPSFIIPGAFLMSRLLFHVNFAHINPVEQIRLVPQRTFLFLHGDNDQTIAVSHAYALKAAASPTSQLVIFKNAGHVQTYKTDPGLYRKTVFSFLEQQLQ